MEPMIKEGDLVLGRIENGLPANGSLVIVVHEEMPKIKKLEIENIRGHKEIFLTSLNNKKYPRQIVSEEDDFRIVGLVKGIISKPTIDSF